MVRVGVRRPTLAVVSYAETPVGPYAEALLAELHLPLRVSVPWIVVDSPASAAGGRQHWGLPKTVARLEVDVDLRRDHAGARVDATPGELRLHARAAGPRVPVVGAAVLTQPGRGPAALRFRGRARAAFVRVAGGPSAGDGPGAVLAGVLHLTAPSPTGSATGVPGSRA